MVGGCSGHSCSDAKGWPCGTKNARENSVQNCVSVTPAQSIAWPEPDQLRFVFSLNTRRSAKLRKGVDNPRMSLEHQRRERTTPEAATTEWRDEATRPTEHADLAGAAYVARVSIDHRKNHGLYLTPVPVAYFMAGQIAASGDIIRILDPAAGAGILLCAAVEALVARSKAPRRIELVACEVDAALAGILADVLDDLRDWAAVRGTNVGVKVICSDFILEHAAALRSMGGFLPHLQPGHDFDVVIANPPYFKLNKGDPRAQAAAAVIHGQPNI